MAFILALPHADCCVWLSSILLDTFTKWSCCRYHSYQSFVSNGIYLNASGCMAPIGLLCLGAFHPAWYLHQLLQREGITHDYFMCQIAFILVLLDAYHVFDCCVCQPFVGLHYITLHSQDSQWISYYISASKWLFSHCIALHCVAFHYITVHCIPLHRATFTTLTTLRVNGFFYTCAWTCDSLVADETQQDGRSGVWTRGNIMSKKRQLAS